MHVSEKCIELIKSFEGCYLKAYYDCVNVITIGYGTTNADRNITGCVIVPGMVISQDTADKWLRESVENKYLPNVAKYDHVYHWTQNQIDALVSFAYNIGSIDQLTANGSRTISQISEKILAYNKAGGKVLKGLVRRREAEKALFDAKEDVAAVPGWNKDEGGWWYLRPDGTFPADQWELINHHWYVFNRDGYMLTGWNYLDGEWFYLEENGDYEGACWHACDKGNGSLERWYVK